MPSFILTSFYAAVVRDTIKRLYNIRFICKYAFYLHGYNIFQQSDKTVQGVSGAKKARLQAALCRHGGELYFQVQHLDKKKKKFI